MYVNARLENAARVEEKAKALFGLDLPSALDLVKRGDYDSDEALFGRLYSRRDGAQQPRI